MGGHRVESQGPGDDGWEEEGYDESQRAEILEATRDGPSDGTILTDLEPDLVGESDDEDDDLDTLSMADDETGEEDEDAEADPADIEEDELQDDLDEDQLDEDDEDLGDQNDVALRP